MRPVKLRLAGWPVFALRRKWVDCSIRLARLSGAFDRRGPIPQNGGAKVKSRWFPAAMSALFPDTHPRMEALQIALWRQAGPARKMHMLAQLNASARTLALAGLRALSRGR
ncbi:MAG: hypothetical protein NZM18_04460 [Thermoflexales bacterium]|nr:hypothetical protein [Thermoflexales bacterium]MDW8350743.1 hypothetical protein [Anaerolineae bacterium]